LRILPFQPQNPYSQSSESKEESVRHALLPLLSEKFFFFAVPMRAIELMGSTQSFSPKQLCTLFLDYILVKKAKTTSFNFDMCMRNCEYVKHSKFSSFSSFQEHLYTAFSLKAKKLEFRFYEFFGPT
jgi:hypothetical protein